MIQRTISLFILFLITVNILQAQCITEQLHENDWVFTSGQMESQVWTAECDGDLEEVEFWPHETWGGATTLTFYLRAYDGCENLWTVPGIQVSPGDISSVILADGSGTSRTVVNGTQYMLAFISDTDTEPTRLKVSTSNPYSGGSYAITTENQDPWCDDFFPNWDLWFRASVDEVLGPLPVELISFKAEAIESENQVNLLWETATEFNNAGFEIQRSSNAQNWEVIDFVEGQGSTTLSQEYIFKDWHPLSGNNYYRLKQIDYDGKFEFSNIEQITFNYTPSKLLNIYPNPSNGVFNINVYNAKQQTAFVKLFDSTGKIIWNQRFPEGDMPTVWQKSFDLPQHEVYFLTTQIGTLIESQKVVVISKN